MVKFDEVISATNLQPRPYQARIVQSVYNMFTGQHTNGKGEIEPSAKSVMVESPTGSGKTSMGLMGSKMLQMSMPDLQVLWVAMRRNLLTQAEKENAAKNIGVRNIQFVSMFQKNVGELVNKDRPTLIVVDESQHDAASSMATIHSEIQPEYVLGLSATPFRTDDLKLCFEKIIKDAGIHRLISDGYLSQFDHYTIDDWGVETVARKYLADVEKWGKSIFYFVNLEQCYQFNRILTDAGIRSDVVTGSTDVEAQSEQFGDDRLQVLVNCMKLTEGFDCPSIKTVWVRDSSKGPTIQMAGRVLRTHADHPVKQIVQSKLTKYPFLKVAHPRYQFLQHGDAWRSLTVNKHLELINRNARIAIATNPIVLPKIVRDSSFGPAKKRF